MLLIFKRQSDGIFCILYAFCTLVFYCYDIIWSISFQCFKVV